MTITQRLKTSIGRSWTLGILHTLYLLMFRPRSIAIVKYPTFRGWGMTTTARLPWQNGGGHPATKRFSQTDAELKYLVAGGSFTLSQFSHMAQGVDERTFLDELTWRHYFVYWSSLFAIKNTAVAQKNLVECGVCDGLTSFYAISAARDSTQSYCAYLYDAWTGMEQERLMDSEKHLAGEYAYLDMRATQRNLSHFDADTIHFKKGHIPESFSTADNPDRIVWLHIDLNAATATIHALDFFWGKLADGGVVLFDDYALPGYHDTQNVIEQWAATTNASLLHLPTGQAIVVKSGHPK